MLILEEFYAWRFAAQDFREDVVAVIVASKAHQNPSSS
jgi:hypothetical protein